MKRIWLVLLLLLMVSPAVAETDRSNTFDIVYGSSRSDEEGDNDLGQEDAIAGASINFPLSNRWDLKVGIDRTSAGVSDTGHIFRYGIPVTLEGRFLNPTSRANGYFGFGILPNISEGLEVEDPNSDMTLDMDQTTFAWQVKVGGELWLDKPKTIALFGDAIRQEEWDNDLGENSRWVYVFGLRVNPQAVINSP